jgi:hypothetical protein
MQTIGNGGTLRFPFPRRLQRAAYSPHRDFAFLQRFFTPRTVFMELGAADCDLTLQAASYVERVYAVDVAGRFLERVLLPCNLRLVLCDGVRVPVQEASIDVAWSGRFLGELLPDEQLEHLRSVRRALVPGGVYFTSVRAEFARAGFSSVQAYFGGVRIPLAVARFFPRRNVRYAAR